MKCIVSFSGGKDSLAGLIYAVNKYGTNKVEAVFCDTGWEHQITYAHIKHVVEKLGVKLVTLKSKKYVDFVDMAKKKKRFPSTKARFCTEELKTKPMIDYILEQKEHLLIIQGIRKDESASRSKMEKQCEYFKYYFQPYGVDKKGRKKFHTYRKYDVMEWKAKYADMIDRPVFDWTAQEVIDYILQNGLKPNPLYYMGMARVGCMPCIMCRKQEVKSMKEFLPDAVERLQKAEEEVGRSFFPPKYIPDRFCSKQSKGKKFPTVDDVLKYVGRNDAQEDMFHEKGEHRCMSFYGICE